MIAQSSHEEKQKTIQEEMQKQMKQILVEKKLEYVRFGIKFVKEILPDKRTGKKKLIISEEV